MSRLNRRRFLTIAAASVAVPAGAMPDQSALWRGRAMGAGAVLKLSGLSATEAAPIFARIEAELTRLEAIFSLYQPSELGQLNRDGRLDAPSAELLEVLSLSDGLNRASGGVFDPSIQPLWRARAEQRDVTGLPVGWQGVRFDARQVVLQPGMALTLNGIAQGFITDRITALLRDQGLRDVLMDMGEVAALGQKRPGVDWVAGVADPAGRVVARVQIRDRALATSAVRGTVLGGMPHILRPDGSAALREMVAVSAPRAVLADGLSTALCLMGANEGDALVARYPQARIEAASNA